MITTSPPNFVLGLVSGIFAVTFLPLGIVFSVVFGALGFALLAVGLAFTLVTLGLFTRGRARVQRETTARVSRGRATVIEAKHNYGSQIGVRHPVKLTVELSGGRYTRSLLVVSHIDWKPGEAIDVEFAPDDPANFVPVA
jgi:hypothetical protein